MTAYFTTSASTPEYPPQPQPLGGWEDPQRASCAAILSVTIFLRAPCSSRPLATKPSNRRPTNSWPASPSARQSSTATAISAPSLRNTLTGSTGSGMSGRPSTPCTKSWPGCYDMKMHAGNDQALDVVVKMAGWVDAWTAVKTEEHMQEILNTEYGGMNDVLYNIAATTGDDRWARTGDRFTKKIFFTPLVLRHDALKGQHMNTHVPQVIGAARRYEISSDYRFPMSSRFFFETVSEVANLCDRRIQQQRALARRSQSSGRRKEGQRESPGVLLLLQHDEARAAPLRLERRSALHRLLRAQSSQSPTRRHRARDWATQPISFRWPPERGRQPAPRMPPSGAAPGPALRNSKLNNTIYFHDDDSLYVNLFFASTVTGKIAACASNKAQTFPKATEPSSTSRRLPEPSGPCAFAFLPGPRRQISSVDQRQAAGGFRHSRQLFGAHSRLETRRPHRTHASRCASPRSRWPTTARSRHFSTGRWYCRPVSKNRARRLASSTARDPRFISARIEVPALQASGADPRSWISLFPAKLSLFAPRGRSRT